jgi:hypothetical protein
MTVLFSPSQQVGPKHAVCEDAKGLSELHQFAHQDFGVVGIPVLGAVTIGQFVLEGGAARFGLTVAGLATASGRSSVSLLAAKSITSITKRFFGSRIPFLQKMCPSHIKHLQDIRFSEYDRLKTSKFKLKIYIYLNT